MSCEANPFIPTVEYIEKFHSVVFNKSYEYPKTLVRLMKDDVDKCIDLVTISPEVDSTSSSSYVSHGAIHRKFNVFVNLEPDIRHIEPSNPQQPQFHVDMLLSEVDTDEMKDAVLSVNPSLAELGRMVSARQNDLFQIEVQNHNKLLDEPERIPCLWNPNVYEPLQSGKPSPFEKPIPLAIRAIWAIHFMRYYVVTFLGKNCIYTTLVWESNFISMLWLRQLRIPYVETSNLDGGDTDSDLSNLLSTATQKKLQWIRTQTPVVPYSYEKALKLLDYTPAELESLQNSIFDDAPHSIAAVEGGRSAGTIDSDKKRSNDISMPPPTPLTRPSMSSTPVTTVAKTTTNTTTVISKPSITDSNTSKRSKTTLS